MKRLLLVLLCVAAVPVTRVAPKPPALPVARKVTVSPKQTALKATAPAVMRVPRPPPTKSFAWDNGDTNGCTGNVLHVGHDSRNWTANYTIPLTNGANLTYLADRAYVLCVTKIGPGGESTQVAQVSWGFDSNGQRVWVQDGLAHFAFTVNTNQTWSASNSVDLARWSRMTNGVSMASNSVVQLTQPAAGHGFFTVTRN